MKTRIIMRPGHVRSDQKLVTQIQFTAHYIR